MRLFLILVLVVGVVFRLTYLDSKVYWYDEAFTSLRASGYTEAEIVEQFQSPTLTTAAALQTYQTPPDRDRPVTATLHSLAVEDTQHPPLYYTLAHYWFQWVGSGIVAARLLSALLSLGAIPAAYWLGQELFIRTNQFKTDLPAWMLTAVVAISPYHVVFAQESRQYGFWAVLTLLSTAALLRALRRNTIGSWAVYTLTLTLSFYTFLFTLLTAIAHGLYVLWMQRFRLVRPVWNYGIASAISAVLFLPWAWTVQQNLAHAKTLTAWANQSLSLLNLIRGWVRILGRAVFDTQTALPDRAFNVLALFLLFYSFYLLLRKTSRPVWSFVLIATAVPFLALALPDVVFGNARSIVSRYMVPLVVGVQLAIAAGLTIKLTETHASSRQHQFWCGVTAVFLIAGIVSGIVRAPATTWWNKDHNPENPAIARIINQSDNPLLVSDAETGDLLSLSHYLRSNLPLFIQAKCYTCRLGETDETQLFDLSNIPPGFDTVLLYHPRADQEWIEQMETQSNTQLEVLVEERGNPALMLVSAHQNT